MDEQKDKGRKKTWTEEIEVAGGQLIERVKGLIAEGNVREVRVKAAGGKVIFHMPLTVGVLAGSAVASPHRGSLSSVVSPAWWRG